MTAADPTAEAVALLTSVPEVLGIALTGSHARTGVATTRSDIDLIAFVVDGFSGGLPSHAGVDIAIYRGTDASSPALPWADFDSWYNRAAFLHATPLFDRRPGQVAEWITAQSTLPVDDADHVASDQLDGYLNLAIRALKSERDARPFGAGLDSVEAIGWALTTAFALERRVRPFNKYLGWELEHFPLAAPEFTASRLLDALRWILDGEVAMHRELFALIAPVARRAGLEQVLIGWGDDLELIAGSPDVP